MVTQFLSFFVGEDMYALYINQVKEVLEDCQLTPVPKAPSFVKGIINLRGQVIPVLNIHDVFGLNHPATSQSSRIIISECDIEGKMSKVGLAVDNVNEVLELDSNAVVDAPQLGLRLPAEFLQGMIKYQEQFLMLLDLDNIVRLKTHANVKPDSAVAAPK